ncbi:hypothetical protein LIER_20406 [Lithospermum erythrorhizon]|uniref:Uncharacterized protein n=1 Tax=Lithospermum erythrorhizon TaxID=34254 RepID=A0AAV3QMS8_LITER
MEARASSKKVEEPRNRNVCTLHVLEESPKKGPPHEKIRNVPFDEGDPANVFKIGTTLGAEHDTMLIQILREYQDILVWEPKDMSGMDPAVEFYAKTEGADPPIDGETPAVSLFIWEDREETYTHIPLARTTQSSRGSSAGCRSAGPIIGDNSIIVEANRFITERMAQTNAKGN